MTALSAVGWLFICIIALYSSIVFAALSWSGLIFGGNRREVAIALGASMSFWGLAYALCPFRIIWIGA